MWTSDPTYWRAPHLGAISRRRTVATVCLVLAVIAAAGFGAASALRVTRLPFGLIQTSMAITTALNGRALTVTGTTTLPDGAMIECETWHEKLGPGAFRTGDNAVVEAGTFACRADLASWPAGTVRTVAHFVPYAEGQPKDVVDRYGGYGERLGGPGVHLDSDGWELDASETIELG